MKSLIGACLSVGMFMVSAIAWSAPPQDSPYQVLKALFEEAQTPAEISMFAPRERSLSCYYAGENFQEPQRTFIERFENVSVGGKPSYGPVFPGVPPRIIPECLVWRFSYDYPWLDMERACANQNAVVIDRSLLVTTGGDSFTESRGTVLSARKGKDYLVFELDFPGVDATTGQPVAIPTYGYCY